MKKIWRSFWSLWLACLILLVTSAACTGGTATVREVTLVPTLAIPTGSPETVELVPPAGEGVEAEEAAAPTGEPTAAKEPAQPVTPEVSGEMVSAPPCDEQPLNSAEQQSLLTEQPQAAERAAMLTGEQALPAAGLTTDLAQSALTGLALNVASGQLNRETGISVPELPDVQTVGALLDQLATAGGQAPPALLAASEAVQNGQAVTRPVCARMIITHFGAEPTQVRWEVEGIQAAPAQSLLAQPGSLVKDTGQVSPDGKQAAFTSFAGEAGGPVFVQDLQTGAWTNLIDAVNSHLNPGDAAFPSDWWWEVIGWMPDSRSVMISPADISSVFVVDTAAGTYQAYGFPTGGMGGARVLDLAPDGSRFVYVRSDETGAQAVEVMELATGTITTLTQLPGGSGSIWYPRYAPDGSLIAYLLQRGDPATGVTYAIQVIPGTGGAARTLVEGNLGLSVPVWSPDGTRVAFTKKEPDEPDVFTDGGVPAPQRGNIWMISVADGNLTQLTYIDGWARSPAWDMDSRTLAFVTHDGKVGMVQVDQPGQTWLAAQADPQTALYTSAFFVP